MFQVISKIGEETIKKSFEEVDEAYVELDRVVNFVDDNSNVTACLFQNDRPVKAFQNGEWMYPSTGSIYSYTA
jgi:hypothetical protein